MIFTDTADDVEVTLHAEDCLLRIMLVGGGGSGSNGGAGSGYLKYVTLLISGDHPIRVRVGDPGLSSQLRISSCFVDIDLEAAPGDDYQYVLNNGNGTDGYSGGGAWCGVSRGCHGGADGEDGEDGPYGPGGEGTGEDVSSYKFDNYVLTPGAGGEWFNDAGFYVGGGGGGVMVNGQGPEASKHQGQGYGGGGGLHTVDFGEGSEYIREGLQGVIILELVKQSQ